jgi:hypothetical protein
MRKSAIRFGKYTLFTGLLLLWISATLYLLRGPAPIIEGLFYAACWCWAFGGALVSLSFLNKEKF